MILSIALSNTTFAVFPAQSISAPQTLYPHQATFKHIYKICQENLHNNKFENNTTTESSHNFMREGATHKVSDYITFIINSSDKLPWLPTDFISSQQSGCR